MPNLPIIEEYSRGDQSVEYVAVFKVLGEKVQIRIRRDCFDFQSFAIAEVWSGKKWENVASVHFSNMKCLECSYLAKQLTGHEKDVAVLLDRVSRIVG